mmetsp:Transcript_59293/g.129859  ORF Transcript_59293/g.129859 Transcript_59293/m.129859 type:complete len:276 (+) Transcript_59293:740-1567(+)
MLAADMVSASAGAPRSSLGSCSAATASSKRCMRPWASARCLKQDAVSKMPRIALISRCRTTVMSLTGESRSIKGMVAITAYTVPHWRTNVVFTKSYTNWEVCRIEVRMASRAKAMRDRWHSSVVPFQSMTSSEKLPARCTSWRSSASDSAAASRINAIFGVTITAILFAIVTNPKIRSSDPTPSNRVRATRLEITNSTPQDDWDQALQSSSATCCASAVSRSATSGIFAVAESRGAPSRAEKHHCWMDRRRLHCSRALQKARAADAAAMGGAHFK